MDAGRLRTVGNALSLLQRCRLQQLSMAYPPRNLFDKIEQTAQAILDARALYPDCSLADLYDELTMPPELRKAHQDNDRAVMDAYGFTKGTAARTSESACVAELMKLYQKMVSNQQ